MSRLLVVLWVLWAAVGTAAQAAEAPPIVALVPLDGAPGTSSRDMGVFIRGLADAMGRTGEVVVVSGPELVERLTAGKAQELQEARDAFAEGLLMLEEGDPDIGLAFLVEALAGHERAGSPVVRREEMADAAFLLAKAMLALGQGDGARQHLAQALRLLPDYLDTQPEAADPDLRALARQVEEELTTQPPRRLSSNGADRLAQDLQVQVLVHGFVVTDGALTLNLFQDGEVRSTRSVPGPFRARRVGDPWYRDVARPLVAAALGRPAPAPEPVVQPDPTPQTTPTGPEAAPASPRKGVATAVGVTAGLLAAGAATAAVLLKPPPSGPPESWELQVRAVRQGP